MGDEADAAAWNAVDEMLEADGFPTSPRAKDAIPDPNCKHLDLFVERNNGVRWVTCGGCLDTFVNITDAREAGADKIDVATGRMETRTPEESCVDFTCRTDRALTDNHGVCLTPLDVEGGVDATNAVAWVVIAASMFYLWAQIIRWAVT